MKKITLQISRHTKSIVLALALLAGGYAVTSKVFTPAQVGMAFTIGLVARIKNKGVTLDAETEKTMLEIEAEVNKAFGEVKEQAITKEAFMEFLKTKSAEVAGMLDLKEIKIGEKSLDTIIREHGEAIADAAKSEAPAVKQSFLDVVTKALNDNKDNLEAAAERKEAGFKIAIKASNSTLTTDYSSSAPNTYLPVPQFMPGIHTSPEVEVTIMDVVDMGTSSSPTVTWVNEEPVEGDAGWTAENALKSQVAWKYTNETSTAKKVTAFIKVTTQALRNIPFLAARINTRLKEILMRKIQDGIINGDGTNDAVLGIVEQAPAFTTNSFDDSVKNPNTADVIMAMAGQIDELEYDTSNLVAVMNGVDIRKMKWVKDDNGQYVLPPFTTANGTYIDNMRVVKNNKITKGYALVGDLKKFTVLMVENLMIDIGLDGNDFTYNRRTILAEAELITMISDNDLGALCYDAIATVAAEIDEADKWIKKGYATAEPVTEEAKAKKK